MDLAHSKITPDFQYQSRTQHTFKTCEPLQNTLKCFQIYVKILHIPYILLSV